jgi:hypothetical protein
MSLTTKEAHDQWLTTVMAASDKAENPNRQAVDEFCSLQAYIKWVNDSARIYLKNKEGELQNLQENELQLLAKSDPSSDDMKKLDLLRANYPLYELLTACATLNLICPAKDMAAYRTEIEKRVLAVLSPRLHMLTGATISTQSMAGLHASLTLAQRQYGYWSLAEIPASCRKLDYKSAYTFAALAVMAAAAMTASLAYTDVIGAAYRLAWVGYAATCAGMVVLAAMECDKEQQLKQNTKENHKEKEQQYRLRPSM